MLTGKTAVITGGSKGIGLAAAIALARQGVNVVISGRDKATLDQATKTLATSNPQIRVLGIAADLSTEEGAEKLKRETLSQFECVDILVNNVGVGKYAPLEDLSASDYDWLMNTNMRSSFLCTKAFLEKMKT